MYGPESCSRSRDGAPDRKTQKMPFEDTTVVHAWHAARPLADVGAVLQIAQARAEHPDRGKVGAHTTIPIQLPRPGRLTLVYGT